MKTKFLALAVLLCAASLSAQETYSVTVGGTTTNRNSILGQIDLGRNQNNADVCARAQLPATCTQAQACTALSVAGGASCTAAQAIAAEARIYPNTTAGRESFVSALMVRAYAPQYLAEQIRREANAFAFWCQAADQTARNAVCAIINAVNPAIPATGCNPCGQ
jgi:hypothetical protein